MAGLSDNNRMRRCNHPDHKGKRYLSIDAFYTAGKRNGRVYYGTYCKVCDKEDSRQKYHAAKAAGNDPNNRESKRKYMRARSKALTRLRKLYPEMFETLMIEELRKQ